VDAFELVTAGSDVEDKKIAHESVVLKLPRGMVSPLPAIWLAPERHGLRIWWAVCSALPEKILLLQQLMPSVMLLMRSQH